MDNIAKNYTLSIDYIQNTNIVDFDQNKIMLLKSNFITENSRDITEDMIYHATSMINRSEYIIKLANLLNDINIGISIEASIFEFSLIHATLNNIDKNFIYAIYDDKY